MISQILLSDVDLETVWHKMVVDQIHPERYSLAMMIKIPILNVELHYCQRLSLNCFQDFRANQVVFYHDNNILNKQ